MQVACDVKVVVFETLIYTSILTIVAFTIERSAVGRAWNNGKEVPRWGVAEIQKMSSSTTGRCK